MTILTEVDGTFFQAKEKLSRRRKRNEAADDGNGTLKEPFLRYKCGVYPLNSHISYSSLRRRLIDLIAVMTNLNKLPRFFSGRERERAYHIYWTFGTNEQLMLVVHTNTVQQLLVLGRQNDAI